AGQRRAEAAAVLLEDDLLALVGLPVGALRGVRVGQVLRGHVHAGALGGESAGGDADRVEEAHQDCPIPIAFSRIDSRCPAIWVMVSYRRPFCESAACCCSGLTPLPSGPTACWTV